jgi:hypothetical protein
MPLRCCEAEESHSLCIVLRNLMTLLKHDGQVDLSVYMPLCCCEAVKSHSPCNILHNTWFTVLNHIAQVRLSVCIPLLC